MQIHPFIPKVLFVLLSWAASSGWFAPVSGQGSQFSQFYAVPTTIGPSFAGLNRSSRIALNYRDQWPAIPNTYRTYAMAFDHYFSRMNSGLGLMVMRDESGAGDLGQTSAEIMYSYDLEISRLWHFRPGAQIGYIHNSMNFRDFTFGDQLSLSGPNAPVSIEEKPTDHINYLDASASVLFYSNELWFGTTAKHLLEPNQSFLGYGTIDATQSLEMSGYGGVKFNMSARRSRIEESITLTFLYKNKPRESWDQLDVGMYYTKEPIMLGAWFRGLPGINSPQGFELQNIDAIILMAGYKGENFNIGYSYDFTISKLWNNSTGGAHEISIVFEFNKQIRLQRRHNRSAIACPSF